MRKVEIGGKKIVLAVLCDGMGGLRYGEVASASVISAFSDWMHTDLPLFSRSAMEPEELALQWKLLISVQNYRIRAYAADNGCKTGTTVTALLLTDRRYYALNVGDSRVYYINRNGISQITEDHTLIMREMKLGNITPEQAEKSPIRHILTKCVGIEREVESDFFTGTINGEGMFLLCSDGFRHQITEEEMQKSLFQPAIQDPAIMKSAAEGLIDLNKQRGEADNISVVSVLMRED